MFTGAFCPLLKRNPALGLKMFQNQVFFKYSISNPKDEACKIQRFVRQSSFIGNRANQGCFIVLTLITVGRATSPVIPLLSIPQVC